jgi:hypothetical protein
MENKKKDIVRQDESGSSDPQEALSRAELEQHVRARAWKDEAFRQEFQANPKAVLERDYVAWFPGGKIPTELSIKVIEEEERTVCFVLPPKAPDHLSEMDDLEEKELLDISGGGIYTWRVCMSTKVLCWTREFACRIR